MKNKTRYKNIFRISPLILAMSLFYFISLNTFAQTTETFTSSGSWVVPCGVTSVQVEVWGGGGAGGAGLSATGGSGGGGGGYVINTLSVTPGSTINYTIGAGGAGNKTGTGDPGGNSTWDGGTITANGGTGGAANGGAAGTGGSGSGGSVTSGSTGATGAGTGGNGGDGGNAASTGGPGGTSGNNGDPGVVPGGGGGGGGPKSGGAEYGGDGAGGQIKLTYTAVSHTVPNAGIDQNLAVCTSTTTLEGNTPDATGTGTWTVLPAGPTFSPNANTPGASVSNMALGTTYTFTWTFVYPGCTNTTDDVDVTTSAGPGCWTYCASTWTNGTDDYITNVSIGTINNTSSADASGYGDYTSLSANVIRGDTYQLCVDIFVSATYTQHCFAYFDWNNDGDLLDAGESYDLGETSGTGQLCTDITIPAGATLGETRMRIIEKYNSDPTGPCETGTYGEAEDYTINILGPPVIDTDPTNQSTCYNSSVDFTVAASGLEPFTYQWKYQGTAVADGTPTGAVYTGANSETLTVSGTISNGVYSAYTCEVSNAYGNVTSAGADLTISADVAPDAPYDLTISDDMVCGSTSITLGATVDSGTLEWYSGSCSGSSETSPVAPTETTTYYARAYDSGTGCRSACANITVNVLDDIEFIEEPEDQYGCAGESLTFSVVATGAGLTYQWQEDDGGGFADITDGGIYSGATTMDLVISDVTGLDGYDYQCVVTGTCDVQPCATATLNEISSGLNGTYTVGTAGDYSTLKAAFDDINTYGLSGDTYLEVISDITETAEASLNEWVDCAGSSNYTVTVYPTGATRTISGNIATSLVTLNGADNVTIDGRIDMTGTANSLVFSNTNTGGTTLELANDACNNIIEYATFQGVYTTDYMKGVIYFSTGTTTGNDNNLITYCDIRDGASNPIHGIMSYGSETAKNSNNTVSYCNIYNFFVNASGYYSSGILVYVGNDKWTINNNSIYQTASNTGTLFSGINIFSENGNNYTVKDNFIGGSDVECGGTAWTSLTSSAILNSLHAIRLTCSNTGVSVIQNNTIANLNFSHKPTKAMDDQLVGVYTNGRVDIIGNTIGDDSNGSINLYTYDDVLGDYDFHIGIWKYGDGNVIDNKMGSIIIDGNSNDRVPFTGIQIDGDINNDYIVSGNIIGSESTANSIITPNATLPYMDFIGIYLGTDVDFKATITDNVIANVTNLSTNASSYFVGIDNVTTAGTQVITGNTIRNLTTAAGNTTDPSTSNACFAGIINDNTTSGNLVISNNSIYDIYSTNTSSGVKLTGIFADIATSGTNIIDGNFIHSFNTAYASNLVWQSGIWIKSGTVTVSNNMIRLGVSGIPSDNFIAGIEMETTSANSVLFNSIFIGGTATSAQNTFGFYRSGTGTTDIRNNIFVNARTGGSGNPYAYFASSVANMTSDYNLYSDNAGGVTTYLNAAVRTTLATIQTATGQDANSIVPTTPPINPMFVNPTGASTACDLHIQTGSPAIGNAITGTSVATDFDNQERVVGAVPNGPCIGADENVTAPYGTDVYGIYSPDGINGTLEDIEVISEGGAPGGIGYNVATPSEVYWPMVNISGYQNITASNLSCTNSEFTFTTEDGTPSWLYGNGSNPTSGAASPSESYYSTTGYKDLIESFKIYSDFNNITLESPDPGVILGAPSGAGCPTTYTYTSSVAGSAGFLYDWDAVAPSGCIVSIDDPTASSTDITFINQTGVDQIFLVTLDIETECCGPLRTIERYITIYPGPTMPEVIGSPFTTCTGGSQAVSVDTPDPLYSYEWFDAATAGTQLASGTSATFTDVASGSNYVYVQSTNSFGCSSQRVEVEIIGDDPDAPSVDNESTCGDNDVTLQINTPTSGYIYLWYTGSCGGTLLQAGTGTNFTYNVTGNTTFYVAAIPPGCDTSVCATPTVTYNTATDPILWEGDDATDPNDWFVAENWQNSCIPTCATNVSIPVTTNYPDIGFDPDQVAEAHDLNLQSGTELTFSDNKAILQICGDFTHSGTLTTNDYGSIQFTGSESQSYIYSSGTGEFNNVKIDNIAATPTVTISGGDMIVSSKGIFTFVNGTVVTGSNNLILKNTAASAIGGYDANRYVNGNLRRYITTTITDYAFPIGVADRYALAYLTNNSLTGITYLDAKFLTSFTNSGVMDPAKAVDGAIVYDNIATEGIWQIDADASATGGSYDIALWFNNGGYGTFANLVDNEFAPLKRASASTLASDWTAIGGTHNATLVSAGYAERTGWTSFSQYAVGYKAAPLPVELLDFDATYNGKSVDLTWLTMSEINNDFFLVEKAEDAMNFTPIGKVLSLAPNGNSNYPIDYYYNDLDVSGGTYYYRLKQYDFDGSYDYSNIATVIISENGVFTINPNPARDIVEIGYYCSTDDTPILKIYDDRGRLVHMDKLVCFKGQNLSSIDISHYAPGMYMLTLSTSSGTNRAKLIKH